MSSSRRVPPRARWHSITQRWRRELARRRLAALGRGIVTLPPPCSGLACPLFSLPLDCLTIPRRADVVVNHQYRYRSENRNRSMMTRVADVVLHYVTGTYGQRMSLTRNHRTNNLCGRRRTKLGSHFAVCSAQPRCTGNRVVMARSINLTANGKPPMRSIIDRILNAFSR